MSAERGCCAFLPFLDLPIITPLGIRFLDDFGVLYVFLLGLQVAVLGKLGSKFNFLHLLKATSDHQLFCHIEPLNMSGLIR